MSTMAATSVFRRSAGQVLRESGIEYREVKKGTTTWFNFMTCPLCMKVEKGQSCGVSENPTFADGEAGYVHGVKCFHGGGKTGLGETPKYGDFLRHLGALDKPWTSGSAFVPLRPMTPPSTKRVMQTTTNTVASAEWVQRCERRLAKSPLAIEYLHCRGLTDATINRFRIGLRDEVKDSPSKDPLSFPTFDAAGVMRRPYACYAVPGVTTGIDVAAQPAWAPGTPTTYYADPVEGRRTVMVCEGMKDVWRVWQELQGTALAAEVCVITSTHGNVPPAEWKQEVFWQRFDTVYLAFDRDDTGERIARKVEPWVVAAGLPAFRLAPPAGLVLPNGDGLKGGKDWTDFFLCGRTAGELAQLMADAKAVVQETVLPTIPGAASTSPGRHSYRPVDVAAAFVDGFLYYPVETLVRTERSVVKEDGDSSPETVVLERRETVVIRSDRTIHTAFVVPAPRGTKEEDRVWRLRPAGVMIEAPPRSNRYGTWEWDAIQQWLSGSFTVRPLREILSDVERHFRMSFWLPNDDDYALLALLIPVTYVQSIFDAIPLILVNGPKGTGKTTIGRTMAQVAYNASVIGAVSAAAVARHIDESRGFVALDDLESVGSVRKGGADGSFGELVQALKLSYNRETAKKIWVDTKTMQTKELNFFGVKVLSNTQGVDSVLGSRMFRIHTRQIPAALKDQVSLVRAADTLALRRLRNELHAWAFENAKAVAATYATLCPQRTDRADEIAAPLQVIASLARDPDLTTRLQQALDRQRNVTVEQDDPLEVMRDAVKTLVYEGYTEVSPQHVSLEMGRIFGSTWGKESTTDIPEWMRPDWVGRQLRMLDLIEAGEKGRRPRLDWGYQLRVYPVSRTFLAEVIPEEATVSTEERDATTFCRGCTNCPYAASGCALQADRMKWEHGRSTKRAGLN